MSESAKLALHADYALVKPFTLAATSSSNSSSSSSAVTSAIASIAEDSSSQAREFNFFDRVRISSINERTIGHTVWVGGRVESRRDQGKWLTFIELDDRSGGNPIQVVVNRKPADAQSSPLDLTQITRHSTIWIQGEVVKAPDKATQAFELAAKSLSLIGPCPQEGYPLHKAELSREYLQQLLPLRPRTEMYAAIMRVRNALMFATHKYFQENGFIQVDTPIISTADCEGAGQQFRVTTLDLTKALPQTKEGTTDFSQDFFGEQSYMTVSGQLQGEMATGAHDYIYTFGPTFRAEPSNTTRHLAEFRMIEPEMAWTTLQGNMAIATGYLKYVTRFVLTNCEKEIDSFDGKYEQGLKVRLKEIVEKPFSHMTYTQGIEILTKAVARGRQFANPVSWGIDLNAEHERYLTEQIVQGPLILTDYPKDIKSFYMKVNPDGRTVQAMDVLLPKIGEIMGGSVREFRYDVLVKNMQAKGMNIDLYKDYLDLRKFGATPTAGFGVGFERVLCATLGLTNIRDATLFPRWLGNAK